MSHKKIADDNPQINFCGYPLILIFRVKISKITLCFDFAPTLDSDDFGLARPEFPKRALTDLLGPHQRGWRDCQKFKQSQPPF
jgi:hypothetical protein